MNICIIGMNLTSLILSRALINIGCIVHVFNFAKKASSFSTRTIGLSKSNINFIKKDIIDIKPRQFHNIKKISIFSDNKKELINFNDNNKDLFSLIEVSKFFKILYNSLKSNKFCKIKNIDEKKFSKTNYKENFDLIINCEKNNFISKKYFSKKFQKDYKSIAYTSLLHHQKMKNIVAKQFFTKLGPLAFLPISSKITSIVLSAYNSGTINEQKLKNFIFNFKGRINIKKISKFEKAKLNFSLSRKYYYENILLFGDGLHQIHPLAGQGFNMTIRDLKFLLNIFKNKINNGLALDSSCLKDFENSTKSKNLFFSEGINFIQDFFKVKNILGEKQTNTLIKKFGKNNLINKFFIKTADEGIFNI